MTTLTQADAFLRAICEQPEDDTPRLIYADWLEENGDGARAEFIRAQVELSRHPQQVGWLRQMPVEQWCGPEDEGRLLHRLEPLRHRERELLEANGYKWNPKLTGIRWDKICFGIAGDGPWLSYADDCPIGARFRRGFVESVTLTCPDFLRYAEALFQAAPITEVRLTDKRPDHIERDPGFDGWTWFNDQSRPTPATLPQELWLLVDRGWFPTEEDARAALSAACVAWGREQAGLPPLSR